MELPPKPDGFDELCYKIGLAILLGQKVQFALAHYFAVYQIKHGGWTKEQGKKSVEGHLSKPMGVVVKSILERTITDDSVILRIKEFKGLRNWLAHDFDQESAIHIWKGEKIPEYISRLDLVIHEAQGVMIDLDFIGEKLCPSKPA